MPRQSVRVVLLDRLDRLLLVRFHDGDRSWWCTPGGGVEPGETDGQTAARELREEIGLGQVMIGPLLWTRRHAGTFQGRPFDQAERIHLARVEHQEAAPPPDSEHAVADIRWWTLAELLVTEEELAPAALPSLVQRLLREGPPPEPFDAGI